MLEQRRNELSLIATGIFLRASILAPSFVEKQAPIIARHCLKLKLSPIVLRDILLNDYHRLVLIADKANKQHSKAGFIFFVDHINSADIVRQDFNLASAIIAAMTPSNDQNSVNP